MSSVGRLQRVTHNECDRSSKNQVAEVPRLNYEAGANHIRVFPASGNGFQVELTAKKNDFTVRFNGWHEDSGSAEQGLNGCAFSRSTECRLKEYRRGGIAHKWAVEYKGGDKGIGDRTTFLYPHWKELEARYLQNSLTCEDG